MTHLNLPNKITMSRIFIIPFIIFFYLADFIPFNKIIALLLFILGVSTDYIDGKIARSRNLVTNLGKFLDPIADKLINISVIILICVDGTIAAPYGALFAIILISRELIIGALRQVAAANGVVIAADKFGKWKTFIQDITLSAFVLLSQFNAWSWNLKAAPYDAIYSVIMWFSYIMAIISIVITVFSLVNYLIKNKNVISQ